MGTSVQGLLQERFSSSRFSYLPCSGTLVQSILVLDTTHSSTNVCCRKPINSNTHGSDGYCFWHRGHYVFVDLDFRWLTQRVRGIGAWTRHLPHLHSAAQLHAFKM